MPILLYRFLHTEQAHEALGPWVTCRTASLPFNSKHSTARLSESGEYRDGTNGLVAQLFSINSYDLRILIYTPRDTTVTADDLMILGYTLCEEINKNHGIP